MSHNYTLIKGFLDKSAIENVVAGAKRVVKRFYDQHHLKNHSAYFSDKSENRESYAFNVWLQNNPSLLPAIQNETFAEVSRHIASLNLKILPHLEVSDSTRLLFNVQMYSGFNKPVAKHFDGEYFDFEAKEDNSLFIKSALRPSKVAVLTLINDSQGGGTRLHYEDGSSEVVSGEPGDLLVFSNETLYHSVDELSGTVHRPDGLLRMIIGWRALEESTSLVENGQTVGRVSVETARMLHKDFLKDRWPDIYRSFVEEGKLPPF